MKKQQVKNKILIIDDDVDIQIYLSTLLEGRGFETVVARDESQGYEKALADKPVLIILNMMVGGEICIRFFMRLRTDQRLRGIPVIIISAIRQQMFYHYQRLQQNPSGQKVRPPEAFLSRPPEAAELIGVVETLLNAGEKKQRRKTDRKSTLAKHQYKTELKEGP